MGIEEAKNANRKLRRILRSEGVEKPSRHKTGRPAAWADLGANRAVRRALMKAKTYPLILDVLPGDHPLAKHAAARFPSALELSQADVRDVPSVHGMGPVKARLLHDYLVSKNVQVSWSRPA